MLFAKADIARDTLPEDLRAAGAQVTEVVAYRTVTAEGDAHLGIYRQLLDRQIDAVTFSSASAVRAFVSIYGADQAVDLLNHTIVATIGPVTADAAIRYGITPQITPASRDHPGAGRRARRALPRRRGARMSARATLTSALPITRRLRRLRRTPALRALVRETRLSADQFILPLFVCEGTQVRRRECRRCPACASCRWTRPRREAAAAWADGVPAVLLFGLPADEGRGRVCGLRRRTVRCSRRFAPSATPSPDMVVITDVCLCEYTSHGHCGIVVDGDIANDATVEQLVRAALSHAEAGAHIVAPSDMMDGRVGAIRRALDERGFDQVAIMAYAAKYCSGFYGPFREAADSAPQFGDRRSHQMDPANADEALREVALDIEEGADIVMVKPAMPYLDIIWRVKERFALSDRGVSGERRILDDQGRGARTAGSTRSAR